MDYHDRDEIFAELEHLARVTIPDLAPAEKLEPGERRRATVLFLDLSGFTALSEKMDSERVRRVVNGLFKVFTKVVEKHRGYVDKYEGDAMVVLFGALGASGHDAENAVACGLELQQRLAQANQMFAAQGFELSMRIGVNSGEVTVGRVGKERDADFTAYGDAVNTASHLETECLDGGVLIGEATRQLAGLGYDYVDAGKLSLKGKEEPVQAWVVKSRTKSKTSRWERKAPIKLGGVFAGRAEELEWLTGLVDAAKSRAQLEPVPRLATGAAKGLVAVLRGEAGIGKSRLLAEFLKRDSGLAVIHGEAVRTGGPHFAAISNAICRWANVADAAPDAGEKIAAAIEALAERTGAEKAAALRENADSILYLAGARAEVEDDKTSAAALMVAFRLFLEAVAASGPAVFVLDDVQWADSASMRIVERALASLLSNTGLATILLSRPEWETPGNFADEFEFDEIHVEGLTTRDSDAQITGLLGEDADIPDEEKRWLAEHAQGNPFYLEELVLAAVRAGAITQAGGKWVSTGKLETVGLPPSLDELILGHLDSLEDELRTALTRASVVGQPFWLIVLRRIYEALGEDAEDLGDVLDGLARREYIYTVEVTPAPEKPSDFDIIPYFFRHVLLKEGAYELLLKFNRRVLHRLAAIAIEEVFAEGINRYFDALAHHWEEAGDALKAAQYTLKAIADVDENETPAARTAACKHALELIEPFEETADVKKLRSALISRIGRAAQQDGRSTEALELHRKALAIAEEIGDKKETAVNYYWMAVSYRWLGDNERAHEYCDLTEKTYRETGSTDKLPLVFINRGQTYLNQNRYAEAEECYKEGLRLCSEPGATGDGAPFLNNLANIYHMTGSLELAKEHLEESLKLNIAAGNKVQIQNNYGNLGNVYLDMGDYDRALDYYSRTLAISREIGDRRSIARCLDAIGVAHNCRSEYREALKYNKESLELKQAAGLDTMVTSSLNSIGIAYSNLMQYEKAEKYFREAAELNERYGYVLWRANNLTNVAEIRVAQGKYDEAIALHEESIAVEREAGALPGVARSNRALANAYLLKGDCGKALSLVAESEEIAAEHKLPVELAATYCLTIGIYVVMKRYEDAKKYLGKLLKTGNPPVSAVERDSVVAIVEEAIESASDKDITILVGIKAAVAGIK